MGPLIVVMGVSGAGKSTVGIELARSLEVEYADGDDFHSAQNVAKMRAGTPLVDADRAPWLREVGAWLSRHDARGAVASCSSLRRAYRTTILGLCPRARFVELAVDEPTLRARIDARQGHYMKSNLLASQLATLESLAPDEPGVIVHAGALTPAQVVQEVRRRLSVYAPRLTKKSSPARCRSDLPARSCVGTEQEVLMTRSWSSLSLVLALLALFSCAAPPRARSQALRSRVGSYELEVLVDDQPVRSFRHQGETYLLGHQGSRYVLRVHNRSARRIEAVVTVDGLDVIDGEPGDFASKRGYLVPAYGYVDIQGFRLNAQEAAAFRFATVGESYAAKTGGARHVGVIGVAVFPERMMRPVPRQPGYVAPPREESARGLGAAEGAHSRSRASGAPAAAPAAAPIEAEHADHATAKRRSGLGTEFGEAMSSRIEEVSFVRAQALHPSALLGARYDDRKGLLARGIDVDGARRSELSLRGSADPFPASRRYARPPADWRHD